MGAAEPFFFDGDGPAVVLVHGFTGTPFEVRFLGEQLAQAGFAVRGVRLPGHGTSLDDLDRTRWQDWVDAVDQAIAGFDKRVAVVGQSLGGLLALHAAMRLPVTCCASLAAPLWLDGAGKYVARWSRGKRSIRIPKFSGSDVRDPSAKAANPCYPAIPTKALGELVDFMGVVDAELAAKVPTLVIHATQDHTAPVACATRIAQATHAELRILPESYHLIAVDVERDVVAGEVTSFLRRHACAT